MYAQITDINIFSEILPEEALDNDIYTAVAQGGPPLGKCLDKLQIFDILPISLHCYCDI